MTIRPPVPLSSLSPGDIFSFEDNPRQAYRLIGESSSKGATIAAFAWQENNIWFRYGSAPLYHHNSSDLAYLLNASLNPVED